VGLPFDSIGRLIVSTGAVAYVDNGVPFTAAGHVAVQDGVPTYHDQGIGFTDSGHIAAWVIGGDGSAFIYNMQATPTTDGAEISCQSTVASGTIYAAVRQDRQWYSTALGDSQGLEDADAALIIAGVDAAILWAENAPGSLTPSFTVTGLPADTGLFYVGWVQVTA
jgi:hypothetical protein